MKITIVMKTYTQRDLNVLEWSFGLLKLWADNERYMEYSILLVPPFCYLIKI